MIGCALFGRWIIDAGHDDFHTEIHPPLLMVTGHPQRSQFQRGGEQTNDATVCRILARPYLVSQDFNGHGIVGHLLDELFKAATFRSALIEAHPKVLPPFVGQNFMMFKLRPPTPRRDVRDQLIVTSDLTRRSESVAIQLLKGTDGDSIRVLVVLNAAGYDPPPEPTRHNKRLKLANLVGLAPEIVAVINAALPIIPGHAKIVLARGIETHSYDTPAAPKLGNPVTQPVSELRPVHIPVDTSHVFPIAARSLSSGNGSQLSARPSRKGRRHHGESAGP